MSAVKVNQWAILKSAAELRMVFVISVRSNPQHNGVECFIRDKPLALDGRWTPIDNLMHAQPFARWIFSTAGKVTREERETAAALRLMWEIDGKVKLGGAHGRAPASG